MGLCDLKARAAERRRHERRGQRWRRDEPRAKSLPARGGRVRLTELWREGRENPTPDDAPPFPKTRAECVAGERPCVHLRCRYHLYLNVNPRTGTVSVVYSKRDLDELAVTCALDVADEGPRTLEEVGEAMNLTRERVRQIELGAIFKFRQALLDAGWTEDEVGRALETWGR